MYTFKEFAEVPLDDVLEKIQTLSNSVFESNDSVEGLQIKLAAHQDVLVQVAFDDNDELVGFKIGYAEKKERFYSWLGCVNEEHRNKGIAKHFLEHQHRWCRERGYKTVRTKTKNCFKAMLILNLKMGFDIIGTYTDSSGEPKLILEKKLSAH